MVEKMISLLFIALYWIFECILIYSFIFDVPMSEKAWKHLVIMGVCFFIPLLFTGILPKTIMQELPFAAVYTGR